jgi:DMSO reductase anchor subunit
VPAEPSELEIRPWMRLATLGYFLLFVLLYGSVAAGFMFESRAAAFVALAAFAATLVIHLVVSIVAYRRVMLREWPNVEPIADDDDWDAA